MLAMLSAMMWFGAIVTGISVVVWGVAIAVLWLWGAAEYASDQIAEAVRQAMRP